MAAIAISTLLLGIVFTPTSGFRYALNPLLVLHTKEFYAFAISIFQTCRICKAYLILSIFYYWVLNARSYPSFLCRWTRTNPVLYTKSSHIISMSDMTSQEKLTQARNSVDDIAQIREGRTVSLAKYRNIGIMAHIDAVFDNF